MKRYNGFQEFLLDEYGEESGMRRDPVGPVKQSTLDLVDKAAAELRFRDEVWQAHRDYLFSRFKKQDVLTLGDFLDMTCEQIRRGEPAAGQRRVRLGDE